MLALRRRGRGGLRTVLFPSFVTSTRIPSRIVMICVPSGKVRITTPLGITRVRLRGLSGPETPAASAHPAALLLVSFGLSLSSGRALGSGVGAFFGSSLREASVSSVQALARRCPSFWLRRRAALMSGVGDAHGWTTNRTRTFQQSICTTGSFRFLQRVETQTHHTQPAAPPPPTTQSATILLWWTTDAPLLFRLLRTVCCCTTV